MGHQVGSPAASSFCFIGMVQVWTVVHKHWGGPRWFRHNCLGKQFTYSETHGSYGNISSGSGTTTLGKFCGVVSETLTMDLDLFLHKSGNLHSLFDPTPSYFSSAAFVVRMAAICHALVSGT
eukprot:scaffold73576_cov56-Attheya_sp.AAC.7